MERYEQQRYDAERPLLPPPLLFLEAAQVERALSRYPRVELCEVGDGGINYPTQPPPSLPFQPRHERPAEALEQFLADFPDGC